MPNGWLEPVPQVHIVPSPRTTPLERGAPEGVVWHWTGGPALGPAYAAALAQEIATYDPAKDRAASWHFLVAKDGRVFQSVATSRGSWHVGVGGVIAGHSRANINHSTVGIELENSGFLAVVDHGYRCEGYPATPIPVERGVRIADGVFVDEFPPAQVAAAAELLRALVEHHGLAREVCAYGHAQFDPPRRRDPGPLWIQQHLPRVLDAVFASRSA